jgi:hypothetical protein
MRENGVRLVPEFATEGLVMPVQGEIDVRAVLAQFDRDTTEPMPTTGIVGSSRSPAVLHSKWGPVPIKKTDLAVRAIAILHS